MGSALQLTSRTNIMNNISGFLFPNYSNQRSTTKSRMYDCLCCVEHIWNWGKCYFMLARLNKKNVATVVENAHGAITVSPHIPWTIEILRSVITKWYWHTFHINNPLCRGFIDSQHKVSVMQSFGSFFVANLGMLWNKPVNGLWNGVS